ncbi:MAG: ABC transporter substrate-binding protein [Alphaproteobacteria bacterium]|nr:ABC transporter substrate-binding protein [Alphaproteobacteria bacterium]
MTMSIGRRGAIAAATAVTALPAAAQTVDPRRGGTLVMQGGGTTRHVNGALQSGTAAGIPGTQIFASPLRFDENWNPQPYLAERWELAADGKSLTLHLVPHAVFHDGAPVTSADIAFTIGVIQKYHPFKPMLEPVTGVDTPDAKTAIIRMSRPHPAIILAMSPGLCPVLPKHVYGDGRDLMTHPANTAPIGAGPFRLTQFNPSEAIVLERFDKFFIPGRPYLDRIVQRTYPDNPTALLAMERQEITYIPYVGTPRDADRLAKQTHIQFSDKGFAGIGAINWIEFNCSKKPLDDVRVRQAIAYLTDRPRLLRVLLGPKVKEAMTPIHPGSNFYTPDVNHFPYDIQKAEAVQAHLRPRPGAGGAGVGDRRIHEEPAQAGGDRNRDPLGAGFPHLGAAGGEP